MESKLEKDLSNLHVALEMMAKNTDMFHSLFHSFSSQMSQEERRRWCSDERREMLRAMIRDAVCVYRAGFMGPGDEEAMMYIPASARGLN